MNLSDPTLEGKRHCDQCFRWFDKTEKSFSMIGHNAFVISGKTLDSAILLCSIDCLEAWKRNEPPAVKHQTTT